MDDSLEHVVAKAKRGDHDALDAVVRGIQEDVHGLALRFLWHPQDAEDALLLEEVKIGCTLAMLHCLDRDHRLAYIVGEIMELEHRQAAEVLETSPAAFRKRLQRARAEITGFMQAHCGLANPSNACRCAKRVGSAIARGRVDPSQLSFASSQEQARRFPGVLAEIRALEATRRAAALYRSHPQAQPVGDFAAWLRERLAPGAR